MLNEFQKFIARGNVIDMAVGIIMGAAFTTIVNSAVNDIIMPPIGVVMGGIDFSNIFIPLSLEKYEAAKAAANAPLTLKSAREAGVPVMALGVFINAVINFLIVAAAVFMLVKGVNTLKDRLEKKAAAAPPAPAAPPRQEALLAEIRDLLAKR